MAFEERAVGGLRIRIDRDLCVGFGDCMKEAADAFVLDGDNVAIFAKPELSTRDQLLAACEACPVDALTAYDESGVVIAPKR